MANDISPTPTSHLTKQTRVRTNRLCASQDLLSNLKEALAAIMSLWKTLSERQWERSIDETLMPMAQIQEAFLVALASTASGFSKSLHTGILEYAGASHENTSKTCLDQQKRLESDWNLFAVGLQNHHERAPDTLQFFHCHWSGCGQELLFTQIIPISQPETTSLAGGSFRLKNCHECVIILVILIRIGLSSARMRCGFSIDQQRQWPVQPVSRASSFACFSLASSPVQF